MHFVIIIHDDRVSFRCGDKTGSNPHDGTVKNLRKEIQILLMSYPHSTEEIIFD